MPGPAERARNGHTEKTDPEACSLWADAHDRYAKEIRFFLAAHVASPDDVEDLLQDVFMCLITQDRSPGNVRAYLYAVARRRVRAYWRRQETRLAAERALSARSEVMSARASAGNLDPLHRLTVQEQGHHIDRAMSQLTPALAEIVRRRVVEALPIEEAARRARCSPAAAKKRLWRAKQCLKRLCRGVR